MRKRFALVILNYRFPEITESCLKSLAATRSDLFKVFLINNSPQDGSGEGLLHTLKLLGLEHAYFEFPENRGFAGGVNAGIRAALKEDFDHVAILNNDALVEADFATVAYSAIDLHPDRVLAGLVLNSRTGRPDLNIGTISPRDLRPRFIDAESAVDGLDMASGAFMVIPRTAVEAVGLFDEGYFMYCEDLEFCLRLRKAGVRIAFHPEIRVHHAVNSTSDRARTPKDYYRMRNQTYTVLRHGSVRQKILYALHLALLLAYKLRHPRIFMEFARGLADALADRMGKREAAAPSICVNALFLQNHLGGIGNYAYQLCLWLTRNRPEWEISVLVHHGISEAFRDISGLKVREICVKPLLGRILYFQGIFTFAGRRFSLIHSVGNMGSLFARNPQVITIHDSYERTSPERFGRMKRMLMRFMVSASGRRAARIIANSRSTRADVEKFYPHLREKITTIYMGTKFSPTQAISYSDRNDFLFVGTIEPGKNLRLVIEAFSVFLKNGRARLKIVGAAGWKQSHLPAVVRELGVAEDVDFLGYVPDDALRELYGTSLALIQASRYEGFGLPVIEAMGCGCPVIAAANSGLLEAGGDSALFFKTDDPAALARQMIRLAEDRGLREECIRSGLIHAANFSWEKTGRETVALYEALLQRRAP